MERQQLTTLNSDTSATTKKHSYNFLLLFLVLLLLLLLLLLSLLLLSSLFFSLLWMSLSSYTTNNETNIISTVNDNHTRQDVLCVVVTKLRFCRCCPYKNHDNSDYKRQGPFVYQQNRSNNNSLMNDSNTDANNVNNYTTT